MVFPDGLPSRTRGLRRADPPASRARRARRNVERDGGVIRSMSAGDGWNGVTLVRPGPGRRRRRHRRADQPVRGAGSPVGVEALLLRPAARPARAARSRPVSRAEPAEALLVAEIADLTLDVPPPAGRGAAGGRRRARGRRARVGARRGVRRRPLRLGQGPAGRSRRAARHGRGRRRHGRGDPDRRRARGVSRRHRVRQPLGRRHPGRVAWPRRVPVAGRPPGGAGRGREASATYRSTRPPTAGRSCSGSASSSSPPRLRSRTRLIVLPFREWLVRHPKITGGPA